MDPEKENSSEPKKKKPRLSLSLKKRFGESVASSLPELTTPTVPSNTKKNTCWAMKNFREWRSEREGRYPEEVCREDLLDSPPWKIEELNHWLSIYIHETRRSDGKSCHSCHNIGHNCHNIGHDCSVGMMW